MGLSTHILDTARGTPVTGVALQLAVLRHSDWQHLGQGVTDADGRCRTLLGEHALEAATYRIHFAVAAYFQAQALTSLYPYVEIVFNVRNPDGHYHVPLLLTANGYTTYRGS